MGRTFAEVVERVKQLSRAEKQELQELLRKHVIEEHLSENAVHRRSGSAKGEISMSDDFDESLNDFNEDME